MFFFPLYMFWQLYACLFIEWIPPYSINNHFFTDFLFCLSFSEFVKVVLLSNLFQFLGLTLATDSANKVVVHLSLDNITGDIGWLSDRFCSCAAVSVWQGEFALNCVLLYSIYKFLVLSVFLNVASDLTRSNIYFPKKKKKYCMDKFV